MSGSIKVQGLPELVRAFQRTEGALPHDLEMGLEQAGRLVKAQVASNADAAFRESSYLVGSIDNIVQGPRAFVRVTAYRGEHAHAPFSYPSMWEYGSAPHGGRPFARKALDQKAEAVYAVLDGMLAKLGGEWAA